MRHFLQQKRLMFCWAKGCVPYDGDGACPAPRVPQLLAEALHSVKGHAPLDVHLHARDDVRMRSGHA